MHGNPWHSMNSFWQTAGQPTLHRTRRPSSTKQCVAVPRSKDSDFGCRMQGQTPQARPLLGQTGPFLPQAKSSCAYAEEGGAHDNRRVRIVFECLAKAQVTVGIHQQALSVEHQAREDACGQRCHRHSEKKGPGISLEGQPTNFDIHVRSLINAQSYRRYPVNRFGVCPRVRFKRPCRKNRNAGPAQLAIFGDKEPISFLGVWLAAG